MTGFRILLVAMFTALTVYTGLVIASHGWSLYSVAFADLAEMAWPGQFDLDFLFMLTFSGLWVAWRHRFSPAGLGLGLAAFLGGALFLSVYLFILTLRTRDGVKGILLGDRA